MYFINYSRLFTIMLLLCSSSLKGECELTALYEVIEKTSFYDSERELYIDELKQDLRQAKGDEEELSVLFDLVQAYQNFKYDSAFVYSMKALKKANLYKNIEIVADAKIRFGNICVAAGLYKEGLDTLLSLDVKDIRNDQKSLYFGLLGRFYEEMAAFTNLEYFSRDYQKLAKYYQKEAQSFTEKGTFFYDFLEISPVTYADILGLKHLFERHQVGVRDSAIVCFVIGDLYLQQGQLDSAIRYLTKSAILDIRSCTKENLAFLKLAELIFEKGDVEGASILIQKANEDALFFGARQRKIQISEVLPLIEEAVIHRISKQRKRLYWQNVGLSIIVVIILLLLFIIYHQVQKLKVAKRELDNINQQLQYINLSLTKANVEKNIQNTALQKVNFELQEANVVKEKYIGLLFFREATWLADFEKFISKIQYLLKENKISKVKSFVKNYDLSVNKKDSLYKFDKAFIELFPQFIHELNSLFDEEHQVKLEEGELLNNETRIFALIRLGINHNDKIAQILGLSVNTVYAYKTRVRNRSKFDSKVFDKKLMEVTKFRSL